MFLKPDFSSEYEPKPGDLIEIFRNGYQHWAMYVGKGYVVHLLGPCGEFVLILLSSSTINLPIGKNNVLKQKLLKVVSSDKWRINNLQDHEKQPRPAEIILREANKLVGAVQLYNVVEYNCEHFATELRYGNAESQQAGQTRWTPEQETCGRQVHVLGIRAFSQQLRN
uniref:LRAT domain-containing protein n=1 Tax=Fundulus heteroclitus TaxID=8078 RepID=A0A3Q2PB86_FUNHE